MKGISNEVWERIIRKSVHPFPFNPSDAGISADRIKGAMHRYVTDTEDSVRAIIDDIVENINTSTYQDLATLVDEPITDLDATPKTSGYIDNINADVLNLPLANKSGLYQLCDGNDVMQIVQTKYENIDRMFIRILNNGEHSDWTEFVDAESLEPIVEKFLAPIELGNVKDGVEFNIEPTLVESMFKIYDKDIHLQWSNWLVTLRRHDRKDGGDKVYYSATMELEGTKYLYTLTIDKSTNKGLLERVEEDIIVDMGQHTLNNGATFSISLENASKRNVVYIKIFDKATNRTRFFKKNWIDQDNATFTFTEMWSNLVGQITITTADKKAVYSEVVLADKNTASAMANRLKFNQLFDTATSTLPSANGLVVTSIYGGHNVIGTTDHQYYHKMYDIATISGHWYYFAPNFSNTKSVYILGHIDGTAFSTNKGKVFEGGNKFDAYIQIERDKTMDFDVQPILVDLTEMFGEGNEPTTDTDVYQYIAPNTYFPYNDTNAFVTKNRASAEANRFRFNQLLKPSIYLPTFTNHGITITSDNNGKLTVNGKADIQSRINMTGCFGNGGRNFDKSVIKEKHKYFLSSCSDNKNFIVLMGLANEGNAVIGLGEEIIQNFRFICDYDETFDNLVVSPILIDLTEMFGAGNEPSSVDELYKYIVKGQYYPYVDTPTKEEMNSLSMCPSDTVINNIFPEPSGTSKYTNGYTAPANGWINITAFIPETVQTRLELKSSDYSLTIMKSNFTRGNTYFSNESNILMPIQKGQYAYLTFGENPSGITLFSSKFIYAKELPL